VNAQAVISGYACRLPESDSPEEFWGNLIEGRDMVTEDGRRWPPGLYDTPSRFGKLKDIAHFDARFFEVHPKQAHKMDPQLRLLLAISYEAIRGAGFVPEELRGATAGVYVGACTSDADGLYSSRPEGITGYENTGCAKSMFANRLSFFFDFRGPSLTIDTACSSSLVAFDAAVRALAVGECDYALVAGANLILHPSSTVGFARLKMLSPDGTCRAFDADAKGYVRAEGIVALFLTRPERARRVIASVLGSGVNSDGYTEQGITFPSGAAQSRLLQSVYKRAGIAPRSVVYVEAHGTGTRVGDPQEASALVEVLCRDRDAQTPLLVGSVKSNMGHAEGAAGLAGVLKVLLAMEHGTIPANLHFKTPNPDIAVLRDSRLTVVAAHQPWRGGVAAVNSFGFGGTNAHVILRDELERAAAPATYPVVPVAARTETGLERLLSLTPTAGQAALLASIANAPIATHPFRGAVVRPTDGDPTTIRGQALAARPALWWVFPGVGAQWPGMGAALLELAPCREALTRGHEALAGTGIDLTQLLTRADDEALREVTATFVALTAVQIALVDLLHAAGLKPDGLLGHSVGEIACAYADGALDADQAILAAYWRGRAVAEAPATRGKMAAVALDWGTAAALCTKGVTAACHNGARSVTVSGDPTALDALLTELTGRGVDTRVLDSAGIAFHGPGMAAAAPALRAALTRLIPAPRGRTSRWVSTSAPPGGDASLCNAEYFVNNLCQPVRFAEALASIQSGAVIMEVGAHALLRRPIAETRADCRTLGLMNRGRTGTAPIFEGLARTYTLGIDVAWSRLLGVPYPLRAPCHVPGLCHWDDKQTWEVPSFAEYGGGAAAEQRFTIDLRSEENAYIADHRIHGKALFPGVGYLCLVWRTLAHLAHVPFERLPVQFEGVTFHRATSITSESPVTLIVRYLAATRRFEIVYDNELVASGTAVAGAEVTWPTLSKPSAPSDTLTLAAADIYKELRLRGYQYGSAFQGLRAASANAKQFQVAWNGNWVTYLDALIQGPTLAQPRVTAVPTYVRRFTLDPTRQSASETIPATYEAALERVVAPAVVIEECRGAVLTRARGGDRPLLLRHAFVPYDNSADGQTSGAPELAEYVGVVTRFVVTAALDVLHKAKASGRALPAHLLLIEEMLARESCAPPNIDDIARFSAHPRGLFLRLARHVYADPDAFLDNPVARIVGFEEYNSVYREDLSMVTLFGPHELGILVDTVLENMAINRPVRVAEIGAGTGGITAYVLPRLRSAEDRYFVTDVSAGFFENLRSRFAEYDAVTEFAVWDIGAPAPAALAPPLDLIVASNVLHATPNLRTALGHLHDALADQGFLLLHEITHAYIPMLGIWGFIDQLWRFDDPGDRSHGALLTTEQWRRLIEDCGFDTLAVRDDGLTSTLFLCRKRPLAELVPKPMRLTGDFGADLPAIRASLAALDAQPAARLWLETEEREAAGLLGLLQCARKEPGGERLRALFADDLARLTDAERERFYRFDLAQNVVRAGVWGALRHLPLVPVKTVTTTNALLGLDPGDLSSLHWMQGPVWRDEDYAYTAHYLALNFKDVMLATGRLSEEDYGEDVANAVGGEFSGLTRDGRRIMGFTYENFATHISRARARCVFPVPDEWTLEDAATVPAAYLTAYLALLIRARLKSGERVLIHTGSGSVGQAAIRIALSLDCEVFTTVGSAEKRAFLRECFPRLADDHIGHSRDASFEDLVLRATGGRGVHVVLNSLVEDKLAAGLRVLSRYGRFVEIGKYDMSRDTQIGMRLFLKDIAFYGVGFNNFAKEETTEIDELIALVRDGLARGVVQPLPRIVFTHDAVEEAFRYLARGRHIGKVLVRVCDPTTGKSLALPARPRMSFYPDKAYLVTGGLGGVGLELAQWLIERGARRLVLASRRGIRGTYDAYRLRAFERHGARVTVSTRDVGDAREADALVREIEAERPLGAVFHLAMVLDDALLANQTPERFARVSHAKVEGAQHLDIATRAHCRALDHFVAFSSIVGGVGNAGQSNYGYANSALDRLCEARRRAGYPAIAIQWGVIGGVGFVEENRGHIHFTGLHIKEQSIQSCLETLDTLLTQSAPTVASVVPDHNLRARERTAPARGGYEGLLAAIKGILGLKPEDAVAETGALGELGLDSLMAVEIEHLLKHEHDLSVTLSEVRTLTFARIAALYEARHGADAEGALATAHPGVTTADDAAVIEPLPGSPDACTAIYFVAGVLADPQAAARAAGLPNDAAIYLVRYERASSMSALALAWREHLRLLPPGIGRVRFIAHCAGVTVAQRFIKMAGAPQVPHEFIAISPPRAELFRMLDGLSLEDIDRIPDKEAWVRLRTLPFFGDFPTLPLPRLRAQIKFLVAERLQEQPLARADLALLPTADPLCWTEPEARQLARAVRHVPGRHDISSVSLTPYLAPAEESAAAVN